MTQRLHVYILLLLAAAQLGLAKCFAEEISIPPSYQWGRGISWPDANFNLGGYANLGYQRPQKGNDQFKLDEFSLFLTWTPHKRLRFFSEVEVDDWLSTRGIASLNDALRAERLFVDVLASETTTVRLGKFLTPIGRWNVIHAAPLTWTATRPLITDEQLFSPHLNGGMVTQRLQIDDNNIDISAYADYSGKLDIFDDSSSGFENSFGGRINLESGNNWQVGISYINFSKEMNPKLDRNDLLGVDFIWKKNGYEVMAEGIYRHAGDSQGQEQGFYMQGVVPLADKFFAVGRYEYLNGTHHFITTDDHIGVAGLAWRPYVPLVFKAEYRFGAENDSFAPSGFFTSISTLF
ncbi:hypothetical protein JCM14076_18290 [Methylosoma difficile]